MTLESEENMLENNKKAEKTSKIVEKKQQEPSPAEHKDSEAKQKIVDSMKTPKVEAHTRSSKGDVNHKEEDKDKHTEPLVSNQEPEKITENEFIFVNGMKIAVDRKKLGLLENSHPQFRAGDTLRVHSNIREGEKSRIQIYEGVVVRSKGEGDSKTFTIRRITNDVAVERIFFLSSPFIKKIEVKTRGRVRRAHLTYLREGNRMKKIKEKRQSQTISAQKSQSQATAKVKAKVKSLSQKEAI